MYGTKPTCCASPAMMGGSGRDQRADPYGLQRRVPERDAGRGVPARERLPPPARREGPGTLPLGMTTPAIWDSSSRSSFASLGHGLVPLVLDDAPRQERLSLPFNPSRCSED